jgi:hypothetical protein
MGRSSVRIQTLRRDNLQELTEFGRTGEAIGVGFCGPRAKYAASAFDFDLTGVGGVDFDLGKLQVSVSQPSGILMLAEVGTSKGDSILPEVT